jgi:hypothetical protein
VERCWDDRVGETRGHGKVGDGADEEGDGEEVVEDLLAVSGPEAQGVVDELLVIVSLHSSLWEGRWGTDEGEGEDGHDGPEPVGPSGREMSISALGVDVEGIVAALNEIHGDDGNGDNLMPGG